MRIKDIIESATAGATSSGSIASVSNPHLSPGTARGKKSYTGSPWTGSGTKSPPQPKPKKQKPTDNALDMKASLFGEGNAIKRTQDVAEARTEVKDKDGKVVSWKDESDWTKISKKNPVGRVTHMSDVARRETEKLKKKSQSTTEDYNAEYDDEAGMADNNLETLGRAVQGIDDLINAGDNLPEWCQEKIAVAKSMLVTVWDYMKSEEDRKG
jgi:hypothetical protein